MTATKSWPALSLAMFAFLPAALAGQVVEEVPLSLAEAEAGALTGNADLRAVTHDTRAAGYAASAAGAFRWPGVQATAGVLGTDDPVAVFGSKLRQERFGAADLDVPLLNDPASVEDWTAGVGLRWEVGDASRWAGLAAARADARAADAALDRTVQGTRYRTRLLYLDVLRARGRLDATRAAEAAARSTLERVERRRGEGMATDADVLQARAAAADAAARRSQAEAAAGDATDALGVHLGWPAHQVPVPTTVMADVLDAYGNGAPMAAPAALGDRPDLVASAAALEAARQRVGQAARARLPAVSAFAQLSSHAAGLSDDRAAHWTAGVEVRVPLFTGMGLEAAADAARAQARASEARHDGRVRQAHAEVAQAQRAVEAARQGREAAQAAGSAAQEAARLLRRRYEEGMSTLAELLQAEADAARLEAAAVDADARLGMALAALDFALGMNDDDSPEGDGR